MDHAALGRALMRYYTVKELAESYRVTEATVCRWIAEGRLNGERLPGGWRIPEAAWAAFRQQQQAAQDQRLAGS